MINLKKTLPRYFVELEKIYKFFYLEKQQINLLQKISKKVKNTKYNDFKIGMIYHS